MSIDQPAMLESQPAETAAAAESTDWAATALTVLCTAAAVLFVSFIAVVSGMV